MSSDPNSVHRHFIDAGVVAVATATVALILRLDLAFVDSIPAGGDATGHVLWADVMRREVFPSGLVNGWSMDWFAGYPIGRFYYPLPALVIAGLSVFLPFLVSFKLVMVLGAISLPAAAYAFLKGLAAPYNVPLVGAVMTLPFLLFERGLLVIGGNVASVLAGEFAFSLSLSLGLFGLGALASWMRVGHPGRWLATLLVAGSILSHVLVGVFVVVMAGIVVLASGWSKPVEKFTVPVLAVALAGIWLVPMASELHLVTDPGFPSSGVVSGLLPAGWWWMAIPAAVGVGVSFRKRLALRWVLTGWFGAVGVAFVLLPDGLAVANSRLLPFWDLALMMSASVAVGVSVGRVKSRWFRFVPVILVVAALLVGVVGGVDQRARAQTVMGGLEILPAWPELVDLTQALEELPAGRVAWEVFPGLRGYGSPFALQLLPYWTAGRTTTLDGLHVESSASSPAVERTLSEVSAAGRRSMSTVRYGSLDDFDRGIEHLQLLGVRWYLAASAAAKDQASSHPDLRFVTNLDMVKGGVASWSIYEVAGSALVEGLTVVPEAAQVDDAGWRSLSDEWMIDNGWPARLISAENILESVSGFDPGEELSDVEVSEIEIGRDQVSFRTNKTGVPVLVKVSYHPGWSVDGGSGPYRVTPNLMVVVPTSNPIVMRYTPTRTDTIGIAISVLGVLGLLTLVVQDLRSALVGRLKKEETA